jgi:[protein-PII] uridylyltransferase
MFLTSGKASRDQEEVVKAVLPLLWDLKLKVGHSVRSVPQLISLAKKDMTIRTAFLEARLDYETNLRAEAQIESLHAKIDALHQEIARLARVD